MAHKLWPGAFSFLAAPERDLAKEWDDITLAVSRGDVLFVDAWTESPANEMAQRIYQAAALMKEGFPSQVAKAEAKDLVELTRSSELRVRYFAVQKLGQMGDEAAGPRLLEMLADPEWLVRKAAVNTQEGKGNSLARIPR